MNPFRYSTTGRIERRLIGNGKKKLSYVVLYLSDELERSLCFGPGSRLRIEGVMGGQYVALAFVPAKDANHYLMISPELLSAMQLEVGDEVTLVFNPVEDALVDVPYELEEAIAADPEAQALWNGLTPGKQRTWSVYVDRAKRPATRRAKAEEVVDRVRRGLLGQRDPWP